MWHSFAKQAPISCFANRKGVTVIIQVKMSSSCSAPRSPPHRTMDFDDEIVDEARVAVNSQLGAKKRSFAEKTLSRSDKMILDAFEKRCREVNPGQAVLDYTRALFHFLMPLAEEDEFSRPAKLLVLVVVRVIDLVNSKKLSVDKRVMDCLSFLAQQISSLPRRLLPSVVEAVVSNLEIAGSNDEGRSLELLPNCLTLIVSSVDSVLVSGEQGDNLEINGREYRDHILARLLGISWSKSLLTKMAGMLRELPLETGHAEDFVRKVFTHMKDVEPQDLPTLVYQLLLLASHGHKRAIISGIMSFFGNLQAFEVPRGVQNGSKQGVDVFRQVEGTVILHINFAIKQDPALGMEWLALARLGSGPVTPFTVSVLLSLARIQRFEQPCFDILKAAAMKSYQDCDRCRDSVWASSVLGATCLRTAKAVEQSFMRTVQSSAFGWDHVIPSVVQMGFIFIESCHQATRLSSSDDARRTESGSETQELGLQMLITAFKVHEMARDEIIEQSKCRILGPKPQQSAIIIRMLALLVQNLPHLMVGQGGRLKECLDYFTFLPSALASSIIQALCPLFQLSGDLQDYTILVLRKSMFGREASTRMTAVQGLLDLIIAEKQARVFSKKSDSESWARMSNSDASSSQSYSQRDPRPGPRGCNRSLLRELLGLLRRCLSQQVPVREALYKRLPSLVLVDPASAEDVFDLVWSHFRNFYEEGEDGTASLKLRNCVVIHNMTVNLEEPFDNLLMCVHHLLTIQPQGAQRQNSGDGFGFTFSEDQDKGQLSCGELLSLAFFKLRQKVQCSSLGDFKLDKTENFSLETDEGEQKMEQGRLFLGVLEVLMDAAVTELAHTTIDTRQGELKQEIKSYLSLHGSLFQIINLKQTPKAPAKFLAKAGPTGPNPNSRRRSTYTGTQMGTPGPGKQVKFAVPRAVLERRVPFLTSPCIAYLLHTATEQEDSILLSFALSSCIRHLKGIANEAIEGKELTSMVPGTKVQNWKVIANPIFQVILSLKSSQAKPRSPAQNPQEKSKKRRKASDEAGEGPMLNAVRCLDELCKEAYCRQCLPDVLLDITLDFNREDDGEASNESRMQAFGALGGLDAKLVHHWLSQQIQPLMQVLQAGSQFRELEVVARTMLLLARRLPPPMMKHHATWATNFCREHSLSYPGAACALATLAMSLNTAPEDLSVAKEFTAELLQVMGFEETEPQESSLNFPVIQCSTKYAIGGILLQYSETATKDLEWLVMKIKTLGPAKRDERRSTVSSILATPRRSQLEEMLHTRMEAVVVILSDFSRMSLTTAVGEQFLNVATHFYKCLAASTKISIATKGFIQALPSNKFQRLAEVTCKKLTAPLYLFMAVMQRDQQENQNEKGSVSKIKREGRTIPNLIYQIEDYERYLIQLSRVTKVNLMRHAKRSTARDFKIMDSGKKSKPVAHRSVDNNREAPAEEAEEEPDEDEDEAAEEEEEEGDEEKANENGELGDEEASDDEETQEAAKEPEVEDVVALDDVQEANSPVHVEDDCDNQDRISNPVSGSRGVLGSAQRRRSRVIVDSDEDSDGDQTGSLEGSAKRPRSS